MTATAARRGSVNQSRIDRPDDDHYPTPREAIVPLIRVAPFPREIWEPACGDGAMARVLAEFGHDVVATTTVDRGYGETGVDFLETTALRAPAIVTNPPFALAKQFVIHALDLGADCAAFLLRTKFLEGADRYRDLFSQQPPAVVYQFIQRIKFFAGDTPEADQPGWNTEAFAWFVWSRGYQGEPVIRWLSRDDGRQASLLDEVAT